MPGPRINPKFLCSKCNSLLTEPMQTPCGHLICYHCLEIIFRSSNPVCPEDGTKLTMENVFLDAYTKRELMAYRRQCSSSGCDWSGPDEELQAHLDRCPHFVTRCPQCKQEVKIPLLHQHSETECPRRRVLCTFCNEQLAFYLVQNHVDFECLESPLTCQHCAMTDIPRKDMAKHEQVECQEIPIECEFKAVGCDHAKVSKRKELHVHKRDGLVVHMALLLKCRGQSQMGDD